MAKGYWIAFYRSVSNPAVLVEYAKVAAPAIQAGGGTVLARGTPARAYEAGLKQRTVMIEFDTVERPSRPTRAPPTRPPSNSWAAPSSARSASSRVSPDDERRRDPIAHPFIQG